MEERALEGGSLTFCAREALELCKIEGLDSRKENKMNYPVEYTVIAENEKIHIEGGADYWGLFNYLIGDYLRDAVLSLSLIHI